MELMDYQGNNDPTENDVKDSEDLTIFANNTEYIEEQPIPTITSYVLTNITDSVDNDIKVVTDHTYGLPEEITEPVEDAHITPLVNEEIPGPWF
jgi:hypothetical protein